MDCTPGEDCPEEERRRKAAETEARSLGKRKAAEREARAAGGGSQRWQLE